MKTRPILLIAVFIVIPVLLAGTYFHSQAALAVPQSTPLTFPLAAGGGGSSTTGLSAAHQPARPATPDLIQAAYRRGEISAAERVLYLAYAVYEYGSLPAQFRSTTPWWGTDVVAEVKAAAAGTESGFSLSASPQAQAEVQRLLAPQAATVCDNPDAANHTDSTNFHVNYGTIGGGIAISDYTASLETTFSTEVTSYGWAKPPVCTAAACGTDNPWARYPVQVMGLGGGLYGYVTTSGGNYTGYIGNNPNTAATETASIASCMVLNSNYTGFPGGALVSLQVTAAHEFVHSIQFGYGDPYPYEDDIWYESIAAYMEDEVYDAVNDNYQYLYPAFTSCMGQFSGDVYSDWLFFRYAAERTGGTNFAGGGEDVAQGYWVNVSQGQTGLGAYNNALAAKGANLNDIFHRYAIASRFMKSCPAGSPYCFEEAAGYVAAKGTPANQGSIASAPGSYTGSVSNNYALNWVGLPTTGTYTVTLKNNSTSSGVLRGSVVANTASGLVVTAIPGLASASGTVRLAGYSVPTGATSVVAVITNQQKTADDPASCTNASYTVSLIPGSVAPPPPASNKVYLPLVVREPLPASVLRNGDFELGQDWGWMEYSANGWNLVVNSNLPAGITPFSGSWLAWLGGDYDESSRLYQQVTIPTTDPTLRFYYWIDSFDTCGHDYAYVVISTGGLNTVVAEYPLCASQTTDGWTLGSVSLQAYAGQTVTLQFWVETNFSLNSNFFVDDTWLGAASLAAAPATPSAATPETAPAGELKTR